MSIANSIRAQIPPIHPEGYPFIGAFALASIVLFWLWTPLGWLGTALEFMDFSALLAGRGAGVQRHLLSQRHPRHGDHSCHGHLRHRVPEPSPWRLVLRPAG